VNNVILLPCNARNLNAMRGVIAEAARAHGEIKRRHAFGVAWGWMKQGASTAWAAQAARQDLRGVAPSVRRDGGEAA
jgi:hypothetical protein